MKNSEIAKENSIRLNTAIQFIEENLATKLSLEIIAEKAHFSPFHFHRLFSVVMKETLNSFIIRKRIEKAATQLLHHKEKTITEVSEDLGFNDLSSFSKAFKKFYGISPNQFKKKVLKNLARFAKLKARMDKLKLPLNTIFVI